MNSNRFLTVFYICVLISIFGCKKGFFDQVPDDRLTLEATFKNRVTTERYLAGVYGKIRREVDHNGSNTPWEGLSDDQDITYNDYPTYAMNLGNWDINTSSYNYWGYYYEGIRSASVFIANVDKNQDMSAAEIQKFKAEARVLKAWFYFCLLRQYGPVVIMPEIPIDPDATIEELSIPRSPYDDCVNYIVDQIDMAIPDLPKQPVNTRDWGRINQGMAMGIKSRLLLYAASPLYNGNTDYADFKNLDGTALINQTYNEDKWRKAANAAKDLIDLGNYALYIERDGAGNINPYLSLRNVFLKDWNPEIIMANGSHSDMQPIDKSGNPRVLGGWSAWGPTQQLIDDYFMDNGRAINDPSSGYSESGFTSFETAFYATGTFNMYVGREPRFYNAISFDQSKWLNNDKGVNGQPIVIQHYSGGNSGIGSSRNYSRTGYVNRKMVHPSTTLSPDRWAGRMETLMRLAEVYLNYAEALNEYDPTHSDILKYINLIRERAGIPQYGVGTNPVPVPVGKAELRIAIRKERRIEMAFENLRFFDTRRWKIAEFTDGGDFYGMNVESTNKTNFARRTVFETRIWKNRQYLWNISQNELNRNKKLVGNPGW